MATFKSVSDLAKYIEKNHIKKALETTVAEQVSRTLKEHVVEDVYDAYDSQYERTGGLLQDRNIDTHMEDDNTLSVRSTRSEDGRDIASIIEYGTGYSYPGLDAKIGARPFHEETVEELENTGLHKKAMYDGLKKQGLNVKV